MSKPHLKLKFKMLPHYEKMNWEGPLYDLCKEMEAMIEDLVEENKHTWNPIND